MATSTSGDDVLSRIISRDVTKAARGAAILYIVNLVGLILIDTVLFLAGTPIFFFVQFSGFDPIIDGIAIAITIYALFVFILGKHRQSAQLGAHFYIVGLLGLGVGGLFFSWGGWQFLSIGYWLRSYRKSGVARSPRDDGEIVAYGSESLVNKKTSKLVRIGYDYPKRWVYVGVPAAVVGYALLFLETSLYGSFWFPIVSRIRWILLIDGLSFLAMMFTQRAYLGGIVRLPSDTESATQSV